MISLWKLREKKNVAQMHFVKITPALRFDDAKMTGVVYIPMYA